MQHMKGLVSAIADGGKLLRGVAINCLTRLPKKCGNLHGGLHNERYAVLHMNRWQPEMPCHAHTTACLLWRMAALWLH